VEYFNNQDVVALIEGKSGIIALIDEVATFNDASTDKLMNTLERSLMSHEHFAMARGGGRPRGKIGVKPHRPSIAILLNAVGLSREDREETKEPLSSRAAAAAAAAAAQAATARFFTIRHYAGNVTYDTSLFLEKNADSFYSSLKSTMSTSQVPLVASVFREAVGASRKPLSIGSQFKEQVLRMERDLRRAQPRYVRCVKPNDEKRKGRFNLQRVVHQVQYLGLLENVRVRRAGYCYRASYDSFLRRYFLVSEDSRPYRVGLRAFQPGNPELSRRVAAALLSSGRPRTLLGDRSGSSDKLVYEAGKDYDLGQTKIFIRNPETIFDLEGLRRKQIWHMVIPVQIAFRRFLRRKRAAFKIQSIVRGFIHRWRVKAMRRRFRNKPPRLYAIALQRVWRGRQDRRALPPDIAHKCWLLATAQQRRFDASVRLNSVFRRFLARIYAMRLRRAALTMSWCCRKLVARLRAIRAAKAEEEEIVAALQRGVQVRRLRRGGAFATRGQAVDATLLLEPGPWKLRWTPNAGASSRGRVGVPLKLLGRVERGRVTDRATGHIRDGQAARAFSLVPDPQATTRRQGSLKLKPGETFDFIASTPQMRDKLSRVFLRLLAKERGGPSAVGGDWLEGRPALRDQVLL